MTRVFLKRRSRQPIRSPEYKAFWDQLQSCLEVSIELSVSGSTCAVM